MIPMRAIPIYAALLALASLWSAGPLATSARADFMLQDDAALVDPMTRAVTAAVVFTEAFDPARHDVAFLFGTRPLPEALTRNDLSIRTDDPEAAPGTLVMRHGVAYPVGQWGTVAGSFSYTLFNERTLVFTVPGEFRDLPVFLPLNAPYTLVAFEDGQPLTNRVIFGRWGVGEVVPEPGSALMMATGAMGLAGLMLARRRRGAGWRGGRRRPEI
jgi:hypothetical protein